MKQAEIVTEIDSILSDIPDREIIASLRYGGPDEVRGKIRAVREKLEALKNRLNGGS
jgi:hypothetical protein